jgi:molybdenum cofactor biosynthesis protein B
MMAQHPDHQASNQPLQDSAHAASTRGDHPSASTQQHRDAARKCARVFVLTVSDTRNAHTDSGGALARQLLQDAGHEIVGSRIVPDVEIEVARAVSAVRDGVDAADTIVITGGSGIGPRDVTPEALRPMLTKELPGFGELFRVLSWNEIGAAAMMSRAFAGVIGRTLVFAIPGSPDAVRLAVEKLIAPELSHLVWQVRG